MQDFDAKCDTWQKNKYFAMSLVGLLQPLPILHAFWEDISMDFITWLPKSMGFDTIMVIVDCLTKYVHLIPLSHAFTTKDVAATFIQNIFELHVFTKSIASNCQSILEVII